MQVKDVMTREVEAIDPNATLDEAAERMKELNIGPLPVCDGDRLLGMLTDRDITVRATAEARNPLLTKVHEVMTPDVISVFEDQDVQDAAKLMEEHQIRRLVVLTRDKRLCGIVSLGDLSTETRDPQLAGEVLEQVSEPAAPAR
jgi:CBS domain-containing protein